MRRWTWAAAVALAVTGCGSDAPPSGSAPVRTAPVQRGDLSASVSQDGILAYRAQPDGSPWTVVNRARGVYTRLPENGDKVGCGEVLYRVDDRPVLLLCGTVPAYRSLQVGSRGRDVGQLNRNLHVAGRIFTSRTQAALKALQRRRGISASGALKLGSAVFLPHTARVAKVVGRLGGAAVPGAPVLEATSNTLHVQLNLAPAQQGEVRRGDRAQVTLPGNRTVGGRVTGFGRVAQTGGQDSTAADATIPASIRLDDPAQAAGLDRAPVGVDITTDGVQDVLSVPVTALLGRSGGGLAVEVARPGGRRELVAVKAGLFDTAAGRVQVDGALRAGDAVVVPAG